MSNPITVSPIADRALTAIAAYRRGDLQGVFDLITNSGGVTVFLALVAAAEWGWTEHCERKGLDPDTALADTQAAILINSAFTEST